MFTHLFSVGFRPFFLLASMYVIASIGLWATSYTGVIDLNMTWNDGALWHGHEMIFGYTMAIVAGFLLTAVPNWTKSSPLKNLPLLYLVSIWVLARISMFGLLGKELSIFLNAAFIGSIALMIIKPLVVSKSWRNLPFILIACCLMFMNINIQLEGWGGVALIDARATLNVSIGLILLMISIIGGRIIPLFTANAYKVKNLEYSKYNNLYFSYLSHCSIVLWAASALIFGVEHELCTIFAAIAGVLHLIRWFSWQNKLSHWKWPIVWILHVGYLGVAAGFIVYAIDHYFYAGYNWTIALHIFTMFGIAVLTLGMMTRVSLGHTGRALKAGLLTTMSYYLVIAAATTRSFLPLVYDNYSLAIIASAIFWAGAILMFLIEYMPILLAPRSRH